MSTSCNGDRLTGGVARIRRIPDSARRTTSARPGASRPAAVWNWLMLDTQRVRGGRGVPPLPHPCLLRGRLGHVVRDHQGGGRQRREPPLNRPGREPRPVRPVCLLRVGGNRRVHRGQHVSHRLFGDLRSGGSWRVDLLERGHRELGEAGQPFARQHRLGFGGGRCAPAHGGIDGGGVGHRAPPCDGCSRSSPRGTDGGIRAGGMSPEIARPGAGHLHRLCCYRSAQIKAAAVFASPPSNSPGCTGRPSWPTNAAAPNPTKDRPASMCFAPTCACRGRSSRPMMLQSSRGSTDNDSGTRKPESGKPSSGGSRST